MKYITTDQERELSSFLNRNGWDNECNTPDYVLARFLATVIENMPELFDMRDRHEGIDRKRDTILGDSPNDVQGDDWAV